MRLTRYFVFLLLLLAFFIQEVYGAGINVLELDYNSSEIRVSFSFTLSQEEIEPLQRGGEKEIIFYIDLFRYWEFFPDEFIKGVKIIRRLYSDPMKQEFIATSFDGVTLTKKRFKSFKSMVNWAFEFSAISVADLKGLPEGVYFVKVTAESKKKLLPSLITDLLFFFPSREFKIHRKSTYFEWTKEGIRMLK